MKYFKTYKLSLVVILLVSLLTSCSEDPAGPNGNFTYKIDTINTLKVSFEASGYGDTVLWDFGDGGTSTSLRPVHTFPMGGDYNVKLTIMLNNVDATKVIDKVVSVIATPVPSFDYSSSALTLTFYNTSLQSTTYEWDFGDGETSTEENPVHTYANSGAYTVTLNATNDDGTITKTVMQTVVAWSGPLVKLTGDLFGHSGSWDNNPDTMIAAAIDGDLTTFVDGPGPEGWVGYDFGAGKTAILSTVKYAPRQGFEWRMQNAEIRGSNDPAVLSDPNATHTVLYVIPEAPPYNEFTTADVAAQDGYAFEGFRFIYFYTPDGYGNIAELELTGVLN